VGFYLPHPILECIERRSIIYRINHYDPHCPFIVSLGYGLKPLLACSIPYLQSYFFAINLNGFYLEIDSDGG
jgi:hypothetical protein